MHEIESLKRLDPKACSAKVSKMIQLYREEGDVVCHWMAAYRINGKLLCTRHAERKALEILLKEGRGK